MNELLRWLRAHGWLVLLILPVLLLLPQLAGAEEPETSKPPSAPGAAAPPFAEFQPMIDRPLFSNTRRPPVLKDEGPQESLDAQQLREVWRLTGIALEKGRRLATFSERQGTRRLVLELDMMLVDNWRLERIDSDGVLFSNGTRQVEMPLREPIVHQEGSKQPAAKTKPGKPAPAKTPTDKTPAKAPADKKTTSATTPAPAAPARQG
jgi:hypothetical protein